MLNELISSWQHSWYTKEDQQKFRGDDNEQFRTQMALKSPPDSLKEAFSDILRQLITFSI